MNSQFWVFFDTSTSINYYKDVLNCLAMPTGSILRYEYRDYHMTDDSLSSAHSRTPGQALLVYAQDRTFTRGGSLPPSTLPFQEILWVATRLAELVHVQKNGEVYQFDLKLGKYPRNSLIRLNELVAPLYNKGATPYSKWVARSENSSILDALREGTDKDNWQSIVDTIGTSPFQFSGNSFWRLDGPYSAQGRTVQPKLKNSLAAERIEGLDSEYVINESTRLAFYLHTYTPRTPPSAVNPPPREVHISQTEGETLAVVFPESITLRSHTSTKINIQSKRFDLLETRSNQLRFSTNPPSDPWPTGADFALRFTVQKNKWHFAVGSFFFAVGLILLASASVDAIPSVPKLLTITLGVASALIGGLLLWRKLSISTG